MIQDYPLLTAFKRQKNLRDILVRARVPEAPRPYGKRLIKGMTKCGKACTASPYIKPGDKVKIANNSNWNTNRHLNCESFYRVCT